MPVLGNIYLYFYMESDRLNLNITSGIILCIIQYWYLKKYIWSTDSLPYKDLLMSIDVGERALAGRWN